MRLSDKAITELKEVLLQEIGEEAFNKLTEEDVYHFGNFVLSTMAISLRLHK